MSQNVQATIGTHDDGDFTRTAIQLGDGCTSIVIRDKDGHELFMLNLFCFEDSADVDVIPIGRFQAQQALTWDNGGQQPALEAKPGALIAIVAR